MSANSMPTTTDDPTMFRQIDMRQRATLDEIFDLVGKVFLTDPSLLCVKAQLPGNPYKALPELDKNMVLDSPSTIVIETTRTPGLYTRTRRTHRAVTLGQILCTSEISKMNVFGRPHIESFVGKPLVYADDQDLNDSRIRHGIRKDTYASRRMESARSHLEDICTEEIVGVTTPMYYFGSQNTTSSVHCEDYFLCSTSYLLPGSAPKYWLVFDVRHLLFINEHIAPTSDDCAYPVYNKNHFVDTDFLDSCSIDYTVVKQEPGEILFTNVRCAHQVFNAGPNVAVAKNWSFKGWQREARRIPRCLCFPVSNGWRFLYKELYEIELEMYAGGSRASVGQLQFGESDEELVPCTQISVDESDETCTLLANDDSGYCDLSGERGDDGGQETLVQTHGGRISADTVTRFGPNGIDQELNEEDTFSPHADTRVDFSLLNPLQQGQDEYGYEHLLEGSDCVEPGPDFNTNENLFNSGAIRQHTVSRSIPDTGDDGGQETLVQTHGGRISTDTATRFGPDGIDQELNEEDTFSPHADFSFLDPLQQGQDEYGYEDLMEGSDCVESGPDFNTNEHLFNSGAIRQHTVSRSATPRANSNAADNLLSCIRKKIEKTRKQTKERYGRGKKKQIFKTGRDKCVDRTANNLSQRKMTANKEIANVVAAKRRTSDEGELDDLDRQISELQKKVANISEQMFMHRVLKKIFPRDALKKRASELYTGFDIARDFIDSSKSTDIQLFWIEVDRVLALPSTDPELATNCVAWMHAFRIKGWDRIPAMDKPVRI